MKRLLFMLLLCGCAASTTVPSHPCPKCGHPGVLQRAFQIESENDPTWTLERYACDQGHLWQESK